MVLRGRFFFVGFVYMVFFKKDVLVFFVDIGSGVWSVVVKILRLV